MKGYKGFNKGLICRGKQYAENTVFEEDDAIICEKGMHFCVDPLEVLNYYPIFNENGEENEFAEVEALDDAVTHDGKKYASKKLKIIKKISLDELFAAGTKQINPSGKCSRINSSRDYAQINPSGDCSRINSSGNCSKINPSGDYAKIRSSGCFAKIGILDYGAQISSSGYGAQISSSGNSAKISSSGDCAQIGSSGYDAKIGSSGDCAQIGSSGNSAKITSIGKNAVICCAGQDCAVKGKKGTWITLAEWKWINGECVPVCVKTKKIDGVKIKEDTFYILKNGKFTEIEK